MHATLTRVMETWPIQRIVHRDTAVDVDGNGFCAIERLALLRLLRRASASAPACASTSRRRSTSLDAFAGCDLVVGADGVNSLVRRTHEAAFRPAHRMADQPLRLVRHDAPLRLPDADVPRERRTARSSRITTATRPTAARSSSSATRRRGIAQGSRRWTTPRRAPTASGCSRRTSTAIRSSPTARCGGRSRCCRTRAGARATPC